ncbi:MAG: exodeoxyribonuclease V subunit beta [Polyangiales bacterium]
MKPLRPLEARLEGTTLVEASAGTGKTFTITTLFLRLLLERQLAVSEILVVTYTRAATAELRDRMRGRLLQALAALSHDDDGTDADIRELVAQRKRHGELDLDRQTLAQALRDFDEAAIFTIHGFCQRALTEHAFESRSPFELELVEEQTPLVQEVAQDYWANLAYRATPELLEWLQEDNCDPKSFERLVALAVRDPNVYAIPDAPAELPLSSEGFVAARERAATLWRRERQAVLALLCGTPRHLNKNTHNPDKMRAIWAPALDDLESYGPGDVPEWVGKLTNQSLKDGLLKPSRNVRLSHPFFDAVDELWAVTSPYQDALRARSLRAKRKLFDYARAEVVRRRRQRGEQSFDDLLRALHDALIGSGGAALAERIRARHPAALIDEFQDTDPVQYGIFSRIYRGHGGSLFLIGDPKQAIYGFRGADVFAYMKAAREADARYTLDANHRSDPRLVQAVNAVFSAAPQPFLFPEIGFEAVRPEAKQNQMAEDEPALQILFVPRDARTSENDVISGTFVDERLPELVAREIARLLDSGAKIEDAPVRPSDLAVLCRTNAQARAVQGALGKLSVPSVLDGDTSVFQSEMADELSRVLTATARPADLRKLGAALCTSILGVDGETLHQMQDDDALLEPWLERFARLNQLWHERGFVQMLHALLDETRARENLLARFDGERQLTDLLHLSELLHLYATQQHLGPLALLQWLARMRTDPKPVGGLASESTQLRLEHDEKALKLTTVHRSKGLEYPIVFCPFMWKPSFPDREPRFHDRGDDDRLKVDLGSDEREDHKRLAEREAVAESLRLAYVALTRAKHRCYVVWGRFYRSGSSSLGYLLHRGRGDADVKPSQVERRLADLDDDALRKELDALCAAARGSVGVRDLGFDDAPRYRAGERAESALVAREAKRELRFAPRSSSFSRLIAARSETSSAQAEEGLDLDEAAPPSGPLTAAAEPSPQEPSLVVLHDFPAGSRPGSMIHAVYEHIDFTRTDPDELPGEVQRLLGVFGVDRDRHAEALVRGIDQSLRTPLDDAQPPLVLASIERAARLDELEFTLSTPDAASDLAARLAAAFERHAAPACAPDYAQRLRALRVLPPSGFLKGFIDLVFRHGERFFVVDYKSNWLGTQAADYAHARLVPAMREHHYFLQYHLYALALHRHLALRLPGYDYERHFGGVYYLFVRGMSEDHSPGTGVFFDRPKLRLIEDLSQVLGARGGSP